jgi:glyoxylase I family protein
MNGKANSGVGANAHQKAYGGLDGVTIPADADQIIAERRRSNRVKQLHHHAYRCRDVEETRHFYEDILGLPLVQSALRYRDFDNENNFCHMFFELADGGAIAFFACTGNLVTRDYQADSGWDHHIAFYVENDADIADFKARLDAAGIPSKYIDHEVYHSLYFNDPNGLNMEFVTKSPVTDEYEKMAAQVARRDMELWRRNVPADDRADPKPRQL